MRRSFLTPRAPVWPADQQVRFHLAGTEALTLELDGVLPEPAARALAGPQIALDLRDSSAPVSLLLFRMRGLRPVDLPGPPLSYDEALWRVSVLYDGAPAWLAIACDLDSRFVRVVGRWLVRYPVRAAAIAMDRDGVRWRASVAVARARILTVEAVETGEHPPPVPSRRVLVRERDTLYEIPWSEDPAPERCEAQLSTSIDALSETTLGAPVTWSRCALVHRGRIHHCGEARRLRRTSHG